MGDDALVASGRWATSTRALPADWHRRQPAVLERDGHACRCTGCPRCHTPPGCHCGAPARQVDHIGDRDDHHPANLRAICDRCHAWRSARQGATAANARRDRLDLRRRRPPEPHPGYRQEHPMSTTDPSSLPDAEPTEPDPDVVPLEEDEPGDDDETGPFDE